MVKLRDSNFELLRIIAILSVMVLHANFFALEGPSAEVIIASPADSLLRIIIQTICIVAVDVFVLISGWYGIRPSKRGFLNLIFQTLFYCIVIYAITIGFGVTTLSVHGFKELILGTSSNWFIKAYVLLYILAPVLNKYVENAPKDEFKRLLIAFFVFQSVYGWMFPFSTEYIQGGYNPLSFIGLYMLARYIRIYHPQWTRLPIKFDILLICAVTAIVTVACITPPYLSEKELSNVTIYGYNFLTYVSPTTILMALFIVIVCSKIHINSKTVNKLASSSFAVYLVFVNPNILTPYGEYFKDLHEQYQGLLYWFCVFGIVLLLYLVVAVFDTVRSVIWKRISNHIH